MPELPFSSMSGLSLLQWVSGAAVLLSVAMIWMSSSESSLVFVPLFLLGMVGAGVGVTVVLEA